MGQAYQEQEDSRSHTTGMVGGQIPMNKTYYNIWRIDRDRWVDTWVIFDGRSQRQHPHLPFLMSKFEAQQTFDQGFGDLPIRYEIRPIPQDQVDALIKLHQAEQERIADRERRQLHADKYL